jgi:hypothetical protein
VNTVPNCRLSELAESKAGRARSGRTSKPDVHAAGLRSPPLHSEHKHYWAWFA